LKRRRDNVKNQGGKNPGENRADSRSETLDSLVFRAQEGDLDAFRMLYERFVHKILNYLYRMTGSRDQADDLAQDTFVLAYRKIADLKNPARFQSWLFRIAQNNVYQLYRGKKVQFESIDEDETQELSDIQKLATPTKSPEDAVLTEELEKMISQAINELPEKYRTVFVLSAIQKLSYREITQVVDQSLASVKSDIHRARVIIRDKIKNYLRGNDGVSKL
jgi:RNA polymerase sigma-70 factor (ECF subfamily)